MCSIKLFIQVIRNPINNNNNNNNLYLFFAIILLSFISNSENAIATNSPIILLENKGLNIVCNYTTGTDSDLVVTQWKWSKDGIDYNDFDEEDKKRISIDSKDFSIVISKANKNDIGNWKCEHPRNGNQQIIIVRSKPWLHLFEEYQKTNYKSANVIEGEKFHLKCEVMDEYNRDASVKWFRFNESEQHDETKNLVPIPDSDDHIHLQEQNKTLVHLTIDKVVPSDRFFYVCMATNGLTSTNNTILLRVKDKLGALWPFLGIVAEVIILCTIIFIYEKRRIKPDFDESDNDNNTEPKASQDRSSKSQDVRQRK